MAETETKTIETLGAATKDIRGNIISEQFALSSSVNYDLSKSSYEEVDIMSDYPWTIDKFVQTSGKTCDLPHCYAIEYSQSHNSAVTNFANSVSAAVTSINNIDVGQVDTAVNQIQKLWSSLMKTSTEDTGAVRYREINAPICQSIVDCDSCDLIKDVYRLLWSQAIADNRNSFINGQHGDTMTSLQHSLNLAFSIVETEEDRRKYFKGRKVSLAYQIEVLYYDKKFLSRMKKIKGFETFAGMYHTIGNFIPVPPMFNSSRSNFGEDDYWDVTLSYIKQWYDTRDNNVIAALLHKTNPNDKAVFYCVKWLSWFGTWTNFITMNYLQDFINPKTLAPILFKPRTARDTTAFFKTCSTLIERRGKRMIEELRKYC